MRDERSVEPDGAAVREWIGLAEEAGQLREAMASRAPIEQAKGILMTLRAFDADAAWAELKRASQEENIKLRDLAVALTWLTGGRSVRPVNGAPTSLAAAAAAVQRRWAPALRASRAATAARCTSAGQALDRSGRSAVSSIDPAAIEPSARTLARTSSSGRSGLSRFLGC